jgi:hypothetical protein
MVYATNFLIVMGAMILADICWAKYFIKVSEKKPVHAGLWGSSIILFGAICTTEYVNDKSLIIAAMLGAFIGTAATVHFDKHKKS